VTANDGTGYLVYQHQGASNTELEIISVELMTGDGYGGNGFHFDYSNSSHFGEDQSGNQSLFTDSGLATNDQVLDSPTNNHCVLNIIDLHDTSFVPANVSNGNLDYLSNHANTMECYGTFGVLTGKWYFEAAASGFSTGGNGDRVGFFDRDNNAFAAWYGAGGNNEQGAYGATWAADDIISCALDIDAGTAEFFRDGVSEGSYSFTGTGGGVLVPFIGSTTGSMGYTVDFGQHGFTYTPPAGYKALCSNNLPTPPVPFGSRGMDSVLYAGDSNPSGRTLSDVLSFESDMIWVKNRFDTKDFRVWDSVRDADEAEENLISNTTAMGVPAYVLAEGGIAGSIPNGFTLSDGIINADCVNTSGDDYVAWCWKKGPLYGFDIVSYEGNATNRTIAHDLGVAPEMIIVKRRETAGTGWMVYHKDVGEDFYFRLDSTMIPVDLNTVWNDTAPTSSVFSLGTDSWVNGSGLEHIAYLFASVEGFSKVFSYTGNNSDDGPFVYCGFRPAFVLLKGIDTGTYYWPMTDSSQHPNNVVPGVLYPNVSNANGAVDWIDFLSNGFKIRNVWVWANAISQDYVGIAFAEHPFKYANAR